VTLSIINLINNNINFIPKKIFFANLYVYNLVGPEFVEYFYCDVKRNNTLVEKLNWYEINLSLHIDDQVVKVLF
jgi:hypothetical protein